MLLIREVFVAKPGQASKLAKMFKEMPEMGSNNKILTDMVGPYNTVISEYEMEDLASFEKFMKEYSAKEIPKDMQEKMKNYTDMYMEGRREIYRIW